MKRMALKWMHMKKMALSKFLGTTKLVLLLLTLCSKCAKDRFEFVFRTSFVVYIENKFEVSNSRCNLIPTHTLPFLLHRSEHGKIRKCARGN